MAYICVSKSAKVGHAQSYSPLQAYLLTEQFHCSECVSLQAAVFVCFTHRAAGTTPNVAFQRCWDLRLPWLVNMEFSWAVKTVQKWHLKIPSQQTQRFGYICIYISAHFVHKRAKQYNGRQQQWLFIIDLESHQDECGQLETIWINNQYAKETFHSSHEEGTSEVLF